MAKNSKSTTKCIGRSCKYYRKYKILLRLIILGGICFVSALCIIGVYDNYDQTLPITDPRRLQKVILRLVTNLPLPRPDLLSQTTTEAICRFEIIPPRKERVLCAIKKSYSVIKTLQKFGKAMNSKLNKDGSSDQQAPEVAWESMDVDPTEPDFYDIPVGTEPQQLEEELEPSIEIAMPFIWRPTPFSTLTTVAEQYSSSEETHTEPSTGPPSIDEESIVPAFASRPIYMRDPVYDSSLTQGVSKKTRPPNIELPTSIEIGKDQRPKRARKPSTPHPIETKEQLYGMFKSLFPIYDTQTPLSEEASTSEMGNNNDDMPSTSGKKRPLSTGDPSEAKIFKAADDEAEDTSYVGDMDAVIDSVLYSGPRGRD